jgi:hypothetical protein
VSFVAYLEINPDISVIPVCEFEIIHKGEIKSALLLVQMARPGTPSWEDLQAPPSAQARVGLLLSPAALHPQAK